MVNYENYLLVLFKNFTKRPPNREYKYNNFLIFFVTLIPLIRNLPSTNLHNMVLVMQPNSTRVLVAINYIFKIKILLFSCFAPDNSVQAH